jgi:hypothetical protein
MQHLIRIERDVTETCKETLMTKEACKDIAPRD